MYLIYMELFIFLLVCPCAVPLSLTCLNKNLFVSGQTVSALFEAGVTKGLQHHSCSRAASACQG